MPSKNSKNVNYKKTLTQEECGCGKAALLVSFMGASLVC